MQMQHGSIVQMTQEGAQDRPLKSVAMNNVGLERQDLQESPEGESEVPFRFSLWCLVLYCCLVFYFAEPKPSYYGNVVSSGLQLFRQCRNKRFNATLSVGGVPSTDLNNFHEEPLVLINFLEH